MQPSEAKPILKAMNQTTLRIVVMQVMRQLGREEWWKMDGPQAQSWIEAQVRTRKEYTSEQVKAIAIMVMAQWLRAQA